jgi:hypothetical protein
MHLKMVIVAWMPASRLPRLAAAEHLIRSS